MGIGHNVSLKFFGVTLVLVFILALSSGVFAECGTTSCMGWIGDVCIGWFPSSPTPGLACSSDGDACTTDVCGFAMGQCDHTPLNCDDGSPFTTDSCNTSTGCVHTLTTGTITCSDGNACTTDEFTGGLGINCILIDNSPPGFFPRYPINCDDNSALTTDSCNSSTGCVHTLVSQTCNDNNACTGNDVSLYGGACAGQPVNCDDNNPLTIDTCNSTTGYVFTDVSTSCDIVGVTPTTIDKWKGTQQVTWIASGNCSTQWDIYYDTDSVGFPTKVLATDFNSNSTSGGSYSWDTNSFSDGIDYIVKICKKDAPATDLVNCNSNSVPFTIDNTPPTCVVSSIVESPDVGYQYVSGNTVYYSSIVAGDGNFIVTVSNTDTISTPKDVNFQNVFTAGYSIDNNEPFSKNYGWKWNLMGGYTDGNKIITCSDKAGNTSTTTFSTVKDNTSPVVNSVDLNNYKVKTNDAVLVTGNVTETGSGIYRCWGYLSTNNSTDTSTDDALGDFGTDCQQAVTINKPDGNYYLKIDVWDNVGYRTNARASSVLVVENDITPPITNATGNFAGWTSIDQIVTLTCSDGSGSGCAYTMYNYNGVDHNSNIVTANIDGNLPITFYSVDNASNVELAKTIYTAVDKVIPVTTVVLDANEPTGENNYYNTPITAYLDSKDSDSGVQVIKYCFTAGACTLDNNYAGPIDINTEGNQTLYFKAIDNVGNEEAEQWVSFSVDLTKPYNQSILLGDGNAYNASRTVTAALNRGTDNISGINYCDISWDAGSTWEYAGLSATMDHAYANDGNAIVQYYCKDNAGNSSGIVQDDIVIDTNAPIVSITSPTIGSYLKGIVTITANSFDSGSGVKDVNFYHSSITPTFIGTDSSDPYSIDWNTMSVSDGNHWIYVRASDSAGNLSGYMGLGPVTVDNTAPAYAWNSPTVNSTYADGQPIYVDANIIETGSGIDDNANCNPAIHVPAASFTGTVTYSASTGKCTGTITLNKPSNLGNGTHHVTLGVTDRAGNFSISQDRNILIDNVAPTIVSKAISDADGVVTAGNILTITVEFSKAVQDYPQIKIKNQTNCGDLNSNMSHVSGNIWDYNWTIPSGSNCQGWSELTFDAMDLAGNAYINSTSDRIDVKIDNYGPSINIYTPGPGTYVNGTIRIEAESFDDSGVAQVDFYYSSAVPTHIGTGTYNSVDKFYWIDWNTTIVTDGTHHLTAKSIDTLGNETWSENPILVTVDNTPPVITLVGENPQTIEIGTSYAELGANATDNIDGNLTSEIIIDASAVDTNYLGVYIVKYDVNDSIGNSAIQVTRIVNVVPVPDTTHPVIVLNGDSNITLFAGSNYIEQGAVLTDNVDANVAVTAITGTVDTNIVGTYQVNYDGNDLAGNAAATVTRKINVIPLPDISPPVITQNGTDVNIMQFSTYVDAGATAIDEFDGNLTSSIITVNPVNTNVLGSYVVTYDVNDSSGNSAIQVRRTVNVVAQKTNPLADFNYTVDKANSRVVLKNTTQPVLGATLTGYLWFNNGNQISNSINYNYSTTQNTDLNICLKAYYTGGVSGYVTTTCKAFNTGVWSTATNPLADFNYTIDKANSRVVLKNTTQPVLGATLTGYLWFNNGNQISNSINYNYSTTQNTDLNICLKAYYTGGVSGYVTVKCQAFNTGVWDTVSNPVADFNYTVDKANSRVILKNTTLPVSGATITGYLWFNNSTQISNSVNYNYSTIQNTDLNICLKAYYTGGVSGYVTTTCKAFNTGVWSTATNPLADFNYTIDKANSRVVLKNTTQPVLGATLTGYLWFNNGNQISNSINYNYSTTQNTDLNICLKAYYTGGVSGYVTTTCKAFNTGVWSTAANPTADFSYLIDKTNARVVLTNLSTPGTATITGYLWFNNITQISNSVNYNYPTTQNTDLNICLRTYYIGGVSGYVTTTCLAFNTGVWVAPANSIVDVNHIADVISDNNSSNILAPDINYAVGDTNNTSDRNSFEIPKSDVNNVIGDVNSTPDNNSF